MLAETPFVSGMISAIPNAVLKSNAVENTKITISSHHRSSPEQRQRRRKIRRARYHADNASFTRPNIPLTITAGPSLPDHHHRNHQPYPPSFRHAHFQYHHHRAQACATTWSSGAPNTLARSCKPIKGLSPTEQDTSGFPPEATFGERRENLPDRKPCSKASGAASIRLPKQDSNFPHAGKIEESRMHHRDASNALSLQGREMNGLCQTTLTRFDVFARPKGACCLPPSALRETPWGVSDADLAGVRVLALFLKLLRHTVVSLW
jgi:hypothetical protein